MPISISSAMSTVTAPRIAPIQVVIVPIVVKQSDEANKAQAAMCAEMVVALSAAGIRVKLDDRTNYNPGWKYNHWELKGVPLRIEVGPRDVEARQARRRRCKYQPRRLQDRPRNSMSSLLILPTMPKRQPVRSP